MSSVEISDDDSSFEVSSEKKISNHLKVSVIISSDEDTESYWSSSNGDSDCDNLPKITLNSKKNAIVKNLFCSKVQRIGPSTSKSKIPIPEKPKQDVVQEMIAGISVKLPLKPYPCQKALMSTMIKAIKNKENCILESPTGSGKTLALLCGALAWQQHEINAKSVEASQCLTSSPKELEGVEGAAENVATPLKNHVSPEKLFTKATFGKKSIYDQPSKNCEGVKEPEGKRHKSMQGRDTYEDGLVKIHKRQRMNSTEKHSPSSTPKKGTDAVEPNALIKITPTVYYGARTHKQLQQVIKEFARTAYCGQVKMTVLSSREYSCIREYDRTVWASKNDMCRTCTKSNSPSKSSGKNKETEHKCLYYENRDALSFDDLPPAFDLEELVSAGREHNACPHYVARRMAVTANLVFCPYNYLIDPSIRSSLQINLKDQIVILDEAHNIEDNCREAANFSLTRDEVNNCIEQLDHLAFYRFSNQEIMSYIEKLQSTFKLWGDWFAHQTPLLSEKQLKFGKAEHVWRMTDFMDTLNNHNIGAKQYADYKSSSEIFCRRLREDPRTMYGVKQETGNIIDALSTSLGYLFNEDGKYQDDFVPVLARTNFRGKEQLSLRLLCMNPGLVFAQLGGARCVALASGTLAPLHSLHSELAAAFPLRSTPPHVIAKDRVWVGAVSTAPSGAAQQYASREAAAGPAQDALGGTLAHVCRVTPHGVLVFLPSYNLIDQLLNRWQETGVYEELENLKHIIVESRNSRDHNDNMEEYYKLVSTKKGALLLAVYRGKVSEGMDFRDHQARAVVAVGVPYPNMFDATVGEKLKYNDKYVASKNLLPGKEWLRVQAYRALNQAVGRCVRHARDWGAVLLLDARYSQPYYTEPLPKWLLAFLGNNYHTYNSLVHGPNSLESFMQRMSVETEEQDVTTN